MVTLTSAEVDILTERVKRLREQTRAAKPHVCAERSRLYTQAWKESEGESLDVRWARMFEKFLNERTITIKDGELIVGSQTKYVIGASPALEYDVDVAKDLRGERFTICGERKSADVTEEERHSILEDMEYWTGKSVFCQVRKRLQEIFGDKLKDIEQARVFVLNAGNLLYEGCPDFPKVLVKGLKGIIAEAETEIAQLSFTRLDDMKRYDFLRAAIIALKSVVSFAHRHAALARELAQRETDLMRKRELEEIAAVCDKVPEHPADTLREAIQSFWFVHLCADLEAGSHSGRLDQYLYPFYKRDLEEGRLTQSQAAELLACLWVKFNELTKFHSQFSKELSQGELFQYVTIAGVTPEGEDATNELSFLILEVARQLKVTQPSIALAYHPGLSREFLLKAIETNRDIGGGIPAFLNASHAVDRLMDYGLSVEDARDMRFGGCVYPLGSANCAESFPPNLNTPKMFELALHNGVDPKTGKQVGPATGDPRTFQRFKELLDAFKTQFMQCIDLVCKSSNVLLLTKKENCRVPLCSALTKDCISRRQDIFSGGLKYPQFECTINGRGMQNVANSMVAIKKLIFEEKKISMEELLQALSTNFEGVEELRQQLLAAPKWGNDDDEVDSLHAQLWDWTAQVCRNSPLQPWCNQPVILRRGGATFHYIAGKSCGAFPDGRKAGEPMADANVSAAAGTDHKGPTAVINSASKLNHNALLSSLFNMKFPPYILKSDENKCKLLALIKTYFDRGGYHIQFNMISKETLLDAKAHPENYRDLVVRVAGFSAYFVDLMPAVQDDIIARTEHAL